MLFGFGKKRKRSLKNVVKKPPVKVLLMCRKLKIKTTVKRGKRRVYRSVSLLKKLCKNKIKKKHILHRRRHNFGGLPSLLGGNKPFVPSKLSCNSPLYYLHKNECRSFIDADKISSELKNYQIKKSKEAHKIAMAQAKQNAEQTRKLEFEKSKKILEKEKALKNAQEEEKRTKNIFLIAKGKSDIIHKQYSDIMSELNKAEQDYKDANKISQALFSELSHLRRI